MYDCSDISGCAINKDLKLFANLKVFKIFMIRFG